jgi:hypothetical protein
MNARISKATQNTGIILVEILYFLQMRRLTGPAISQKVEALVRILSTFKSYTHTTAHCCGQSRFPAEAPFLLSTAGQ